MKVEAVNALAQLIAAIGVIVSLFYLAAQIRQNTRSMRTMGVDSLAHSLVDLLGPHAQNPEFITRFFRGNRKLERGERRRARWLQQRQSTLDRQQWDGWDAYIRIYYHRPGVNTWWTMRRAAFAAGFREYLKKTQPVEDLPPISQLIRGGSSSPERGRT